MSRNFSVNSFYSKNKSKRLLDLEVKLEEGVSELKKKPLPPLLQSSLHGHPIDWKIFHKQDEALNYAKQNGLGLMTFAFEEQVAGSQGRRKFVVTHPTNMWKNHICRPPHQRCSYEVIPQDSPCKLYFDLEFSKVYNPKSDAEKMVSTLLAASFWAFEDCFKVKVRASDVLTLDASTATKFSQHLIYQSSDYAFQDNSHVGNFVKYLMTQLKEGNVPTLDVNDQKSLFVNNDKGESISFCDLAVYTKNRNFRLFLACKFEKKIPLLIAKQNRHLPKDYEKHDWPSDEAAIFSSSLITYYKPTDNLKQILTFGNNKEESDDKCGKFSCTSSDPSLDGYNASPWIEIDRFIAGLVAPAGFIRKWVYFEKSETIVYLINGNRYCSSISREHKSNHIKYVVSLPNATYYQSCFDPDCAQSRQVPQPIPPEHLPWYNMLTDSPLSEPV